MINQEKDTDRKTVLEKLCITEDTLSLYEQELEIANEFSSHQKNKYTSEDLKSLELLHTLREQGLSLNEIKLLSTFSDILKKANLSELTDLKDLLKLSPIYRSKLILETAKNEIIHLKSKINSLDQGLKNAIEEKTNEIEDKTRQYKAELEAKQKAMDTLDSKLSDVLIEKSQLESKINTLESKFNSTKAELEAKEKTLESFDKQISNILLQKSNLESQLASNRAKLEVVEGATESQDGTISKLRAELEAKQKTLENLDRELSEALLQKSLIEEKFLALQEGKITPPKEIKGKRSKELYQMLVQKEFELNESSKSNEEMTLKLKSKESEISSLKEQVDFLEISFKEMEAEISEKYKEQITSLRSQIEILIEKKQKEWEKLYSSASEQHKNELLTLQKNHEVEVQKLKEELNDKTAELEGIKIAKNPILAILKQKKKTG